MTPEMRRRVVRLALLAALVITLLVVAEVTGLRRWFTIARLRTLTLEAGSLGVLLYMIAFIVGEIIHVPGLLFVCAGVAIWGRLLGGVISWGASVLALSATFLVVRGVGGRALEGLQSRWLARVLLRLHDAPIRTVALLRAVLVISPPVTYALALSPVRFRDFVIGSALGLIVPLALVAIFFERLLHYFHWI